MFIFSSKKRVYVIYSDSQKKSVFFFYPPKAMVTECSSLSKPYVGYTKIFNII